MRREQPKYLSLIASLVLLHQLQRERTVRKRNGKEEHCVIATREDVAMANQLASRTLGTTLDALLPQTRQLLALLDDYVCRQSRSDAMGRKEFRFTQRELREALHWSDRQLRRHLQRLVDLEYVLAYRTGCGNGREYALLYDGQGRDGEPFLLGLLDAAKLSDVQTGGRGKRTGGQKSRTGGQPAGVRRPSGRGPAAENSDVTSTVAIACAASDNK